MLDMHNIPLLDETVLHSLIEIDDGEDLVRQLAVLLVESAPQLFKTYDDALAKGDVKAMAAIAHRFKGSAGNMGASRLSKVAEQIEVTLRSSGAECATEGGQLLKRTFSDTARELRRRELLSRDDLAKLSAAIGGDYGSSTVLRSVPRR